MYPQRSCPEKNHKLAEEALAAKEQMLAVVSHDIKNPLFAIQLEAQMLLRAVDRNGKSLLGEEVKIQANRILKTTERMKLLIQDLLDKNKSEHSLANLNRENVDVIKILHDVLESFRPLLQEKELHFKTDFHSAELILHVDRNRMFQVFSNLLNNAIKFSPQKGVISIALEDHEHDCQFSIYDSGPGLSDTKRVFEKYWSGEGESPGTGLGLFICKTIIEAHGGMISVENSESGGAIFRFNLPKKEDASLLKFSYHDSRKNERKRIFIIDDDEDLREVMSWALGKEGHSIHAFHSATDALHYLALGRHRPDLIVVDFHMDEMKGSDFLLRKTEISEIKDCPVLMISASPLEVEKEVRPELYREVITKPIDLTGLLNSIEKHMR